MANSYKALTLALFLCLGSAAHAGYALAVPPPGWSTGGGVGGSFGGAAANSATFSTGAARANAIVNVGGRAVTMPATMRFAANAPSIAAATVFVNPALATGIRVAGWLATAALIYNASTGLWEKQSEEGEEQDYYISDGYKYSCSGFSIVSSPYFCVDFVFDIWVRNYGANNFQGPPKLVFIRDGVYEVQALYIPSNNIVRFTVNRINESNNCPSGWYVTPAGCTQAPQPKTVSQEEFIEQLTKHPMPAEVPKEIPSPLPIELPEIAPVFFPTGDPIPNPKYNPQAEPSPQNQPWVQPGVRVQPSPTPDSPWRVDLQPQDRPASSPEPMPEPNPGTDPETNPGDTTPPGTTDKPLGLCEQYPDILACAKLDEPEEEKLSEKDIGGNFQIEGGFSGSGSCPAFPQISQLPGLSWQPFCDQLSRIRPLVLAFAWLSAVLIILQYGRK